ncbi:hypothetical protein XELAEV_18028757mg [Xenopus laevis]|uniref:Uncharacterized protein n=1 Tax=Xenopus laevis TaxID=8355 RepID=A0A974CQB8_XENLA|nr:hypothetical protein XELAEV_18028757mg [Xenopus laevis]
MGHRPINSCEHGIPSDLVSAQNVWITLFFKSKGLFVPLELLLDCNHPNPIDSSRFPWLHTYGSTQSLGHIIDTNRDGVYWKACGLLGKSRGVCALLEAGVTSLTLPKDDGFVMVVLVIVDQQHLKSLCSSPLSPH